MAVHFLTIFVEEYLGGNNPDPESPALIPVFRDVDKDDSRFPFVGRFHLYKYGSHHFAGDALFGSQIEHGYHALRRPLGQARLTFFSLSKKSTRKKEDGGKPHCPFSHTNLA